MNKIIYNSIAFSIFQISNQRCKLTIRTYNADVVFKTNLEGLTKDGAMPNININEWGETFLVKFRIPLEICSKSITV